MSTADNIAAVRRFYAAGPPDDDRERARFASPDVVWHVPGDNPVSGTYQGHDAVFTQIGEKMQPLDLWQVDVVDVMANLETVVATARVVAARGDTRVNTTGAHVFRFGGDGRIAEVWGYVADQAGLDRVFRAPPYRPLVRQAQRADLVGATAVFTAAFATDPWFRWLYPDDRTWDANATAWFGLVLDRAFGKGHTHVTPGGAINWIPPDVQFPEDGDIALAVDLLQAQIGERAGEALGVIGAAGAAFHEKPRFHCVYVGVHPDHQRRGIGHALFQRMLQICDADGIEASLTSTNDANLPLYHALGFTELAQVPIPGTGLYMRPMWRTPRRAQ